jgi:hypothetical protein
MEATLGRQERTAYFPDQNSQVIHQAPQVLTQVSQSPQLQGPPLQSNSRINEQHFTNSQIRTAGSQRVIQPLPIVSSHQKINSVLPPASHQVNQNVQRQHISSASGVLRNGNNVNFNQQLPQVPIQPVNQVNGVQQINPQGQRLTQSPSNPNFQAPGPVPVSLPGFLPQAQNVQNIQRPV